MFTRGKLLLELWVTSFLPNWHEKPPEIFVWFISNFLCLCFDSMVLMWFWSKSDKHKGWLSVGKKKVTHDSKSDLPLEASFKSNVCLLFVVFLGAPQVLRYSVAKEVEAVSGRDVRLEMEVCSDPIPSKTTWDWGSLRVEAGQVSFLIYFTSCIF